MDPPSSSGTISFDRSASRLETVGSGTCGISYGARAGSVGVGLTMSSVNIPGNGDNLEVGAESRFELFFDTTPDYGGAPIDIEISALATGQLTKPSETTGWNGVTRLEGRLFAQGRRGNTPVNDEDRLSQSRSQLTFSSLDNVLDVRETLTVSLTDIDPAGGVTVIMALRGVTQGVGTFTLSAGALDSLGFVVGQPVVNGLPEGVTLRDDPSLNIVNGVFVGAIPLPPAGFALLVGLALLAARARISARPQ